jgi:hypothetical protein
VDPSKWTVWKLDDKPTGISLRVPSDPEKRAEAGILGAEARDVYMWIAGDAEYTLRSQQIPQSALARGTDSVLDASRDALTEEIGGKHRGESKVSIDTNPAREFEIHGGPTLRTHVMRARSLVVGNRLYEQFVIAPRAEVSGSSAGRFFGSFKVER